VAILREADGGVPVAEILREHGISRPTFYLWKQKYGSAGVPELALENTAIKDVLSRTL
jgi:putative transposase